ncbi:MULTISPECIES: PP2C family serine/threonine-protein phosphatase [Protofrankia]|uniref:Protein serine/threonine phosphatase n=1 Tax=Candidatus Protofrankia datiscae TaxID=2716812 RepID=F8B5S4_9ACTN|nr:MULTISPECIES: PP2C family serine/threonine-protein phosphatase [Protofrankia]AEH10162.1 protein serine/threonine phosphatase [Candidatus Protofrankia datiscae]
MNPRPDVDDVVTASPVTADPVDDDTVDDRTVDDGAIRCPRCAAVAFATDSYCEACGTLLRAPEPCQSCGAAEFDGDGFCTTCGTHRDPGAAGAPGRQPPPDRVETDLGRIAGVSDRGLAHRDNEDGMGMALKPWPVAVVCDGVSSAPGSGPAARAAATVAVESLVAAAAAAADAGRGPLAAAPRQVGADALVTAAAAAQRAVLEQPITAPDTTPACTFVAAVVVDGVLSVGWLGDSRVYLLGADGPVRLTADDTLAAQAARAGLIPAEAVETAPEAHTITRWLGHDNDGDVVPQVGSTRLTGPGRVVVCSDGLWNYTSDPRLLAAHVASAGTGAAPIDVARHLIDVALRAGGHDNVTVVVLDVPDDLTPGDFDGHVQQ